MDPIKIINKHIAEAKPWAPGNWDCWRFVKSVLEEAFGISLPVISIDSGKEGYCAECVKTEVSTGNWQRVEPGPFALAMMRNKLSRTKYAHHVGICINSYLIAHCAYKVGTLVVTRSQLDIQGWEVLYYLQHKEVICQL